jgi:virginiamycin B lyase
VPRYLFALFLVLASPLVAQDIPIATRALTTLRLPGSADFLAIDGTSAWVTNEDRVERLVENRATPVATVVVGEPCGAMVVAFGSLWVADCQARGIVRIDPATATIVARVATGLAAPDGELSLAAGAGAVWVLADSAGVLLRLDPTRNVVVAHIPVAPASFAAAFGFGSVWITSTQPAGLVQRIDPTRDTVVATIPVGPTPRFLTVGEGRIWTLNQGDGSVSAIDPDRNTVMATIPVGAEGPGGDIAAGAGAVWVRATKVLLAVIDPRRLRVVSTYGPPAGSGAVRVSRDRVWITAHDIQTVWTIPTTR